MSAARQVRPLLRFGNADQGDSAPNADGSVGNPAAADNQQGVVPEPTPDAPDTSPNVQQILGGAGLIPQSSTDEMAQGQAELARIRAGGAAPTNGVDLSGGSLPADVQQSLAPEPTQLLGTALDPTGGRLGLAGSALLSPWNLLLPGAVEAQGALRVGLGAAAGIGAQQGVDRVLPKDTDPLVRMLAGVGAGVAAGGLAAEGDHVIGGIDRAMNPAKLPEEAQQFGRQPFQDLRPYQAERQMAGGADNPAGFTNVNPKDVQFRPDLFQRRDVTAGQPFDQPRVDEIVKNYDPEKFDPVKIVHDSSTGQDIVYGGQHRMGAAQQMDLTEVPARISTADLSDPAQLAEYKTRAALDNSLQREQNTRERFNAYDTARQGGMTPDDIAAETGANASRVQQVLDIGDLGPQVLEKVNNVKAYEPIAIELGAAKRQFGLSDELAGGLFDRLTQRGGGSSLLTQTATRELLTQYRPVMEQASMFGDQGTRDVMDSMGESAKLRSSLGTEQRQVGRDIAGAERLGSAAGVDTSAMRAHADARIADIKAQIQRVDATAAAKFAGGNVERAPDLFTQPTGEQSSPVQAGMMGQADQPTYRAENTPGEQQAAMPIGAGTRPMESAGPLFQGEGVIQPPADQPFGEQEALPGRPDSTQMVPPSQPPGSNVGAMQSSMIPAEPGTPAPEVNKPFPGRRPDTFPTESIGVPPREPNNYQPDAAFSGNDSVLPPNHVAPPQETGTIRAAQERAGGGKPPPSDSALARAEDFHGQKGAYVPPGQRDALYRAQGQQQPVVHVPSVGGHELPGVRGVEAKLTPATAMPRVVYEALNAGDIARADAGMSLVGSREALLADIEKEFGGLDTLNVQPKDPALLDIKDGTGNPVASTFPDVFQHASEYTLTDAQQALVDRWQQRNDVDVQPYFQREYGVDLHNFERPASLFDPASHGRNQVFVPNVQANEDMLEMFNNRPSAAATSGRLLERVYTTGRHRVMADPNFVPETNARVLLSGLDNAKANAAGRQTTVAGLGGNLTKTAGYVEPKGLDGQWLPQDEAVAATRAMRQVDPSSNGTKALAVSNAISQTVLGGSAEVAGTHGMSGLLAHPIAVSKAIVGGVAKGIATGDLLRPFSHDAMVEDLKTDANLRDFVIYSGQALRITGAPEEFSGGLLSKIPGFKNVNQGAFNMLLRQQAAIFKAGAEHLMASGVPETEAKAAAADDAMRTVPMWNPTRLGLSPAGAQAQRAPFTSISMIRQPMALFSDAATGLVKMGSGKTLTPSEQLAVKSSLTMLGTVASTAVMSAYADARLRGKDPEQAIMGVLTPGNGFMRWYVPGTGMSFAPAAAFRNLALAVLPTPAKWAGGVPLPFAGLVNYASSKITPAGQVLREQVQNKDYYGNKIDTAGGVMGLGQRLIYAAKGSAPIIAQTPIEGVLGGKLSAGQIVASTAAQEVGEHVSFPGAYEQRQMLRDQLAGGAGKWDKLTGVDQGNLLNSNPDAAAKLNTLTDQVNSGNSQVDQELKLNKATADWRIAQEKTLATNPPMKRDAATGKAVPDMYAFNQQYAALQDQANQRNIGHDEALQAFQKGGPLPSDPNKAALAQYYQTFDDARNPDGTVDYEKQAQLQAGLHLTAEQQHAIDQRSLGNHAPELTGYLQDRRDITNSGYWSLGDAAAAKATNGAAKTAADLASQYQQALRAMDIPNMAQLKAMLATADSLKLSAERVFRTTHPGIGKALDRTYGPLAAPSKSSGGASSGAFGSAPSGSFGKAASGAFR